MMDLATTPPSAPPAAADPPNPGFYRAGAAIFYVTGDPSSVFLLRTPDEPACLLPVAALPRDAEGTTAHMGPRLWLLARTAEDLCKPTGPLSLSRVEVRRDRAVALASSLHAVLSTAIEEIGAVLVEDASPDPEGFHERMMERLLGIHEQSHRLGQERNRRRGERENGPSPPPHVPLAAAPFVHRGEFVGTYWDLATAGGQLADAVDSESIAAAAMRDAHLRGQLWTLPDNGVVHVFRCPEKDS